MDMNNIPPELLALLEEAIKGGTAEDQQAILAHQLRRQEGGQDAAMPQGLEVRGQYIAPSPLAFLSSTIKQIQGGQGAQNTTAQMNQNINTAQSGVRAGLLQQLLREYSQKAQAPGAPAQQGFSALDSPFQPRPPSPFMGG